MNVSLRQIRSFVAIARLGSFTRAAKSLNLSQPSLTAQIRQLEDSLGTRILDRNTRAARLTAVGHDLLPTFERLLGDLDTALAGARDLAAKRRGIVRLACLPSFAATVLPQAILRYRGDYPAVRFVIKDAVGRRIAAMVRSEIVDFGISAGAVDDPDLEVAELMEDRMMAVLPAGHALARRRRIAPAALAGQPLVLMDEESTVRDVVDAGFAALGLAAAPAFEATYMATAVGLVQAGLGIAILPSTAIESRPGQRLVSRPVDGPEFSRKIWILRRRGRSLPPAAAVFLDQLAAAAAGPQPPRA